MGFSLTVDENESDIRQQGPANNQYLYITCPIEMAEEQKRQFYNPGITTLLKITS